MLSQTASLPIGVDESPLWQRVRAGDDEAWRIVNAVLRQRLRRLAAFNLPPEILDRLDASDMVQQTFLEAGQSYDAFQGRSLPELYAWLAAILKHNVRDAVRQHIVAQRRTVKMETRLEESTGSASRAEHHFAADQTSPSMRAARGEAEEQLLAAIRALPPRQQEAVQLRHLEGCSLAQIAHRLSCTESVAAAVLARGLRSLRRKLSASS